MKNFFFGQFFGMTLCLTLLSLNARASDTPKVVTYAETAFPCIAAGPDLYASPALNLADGNGEVRVAGPLANQIFAEDNQIVIRTSDGQKIAIGAQTAPTCAWYDTGEAETSSWNAVQISPSVQLTLEHTYQYTLTVTVIATQKQYQFSW